jgi:hypothetical protein
VIVYKPSSEPIHVLLPGGGVVSKSLISKTAEPRTRRQTYAVNVNSTRHVASRRTFHIQQSRLINHALQQHGDFKLPNFQCVYISHVAMLHR